MDNDVMRDVIEMMKNKAQREGKQQTSPLGWAHRELYKAIVAAFTHQEAAILNLDLFHLEEMTNRVIFPSEIDTLNEAGLINARLTGVYTWEISLPEQEAEA